MCATAPPEGQAEPVPDNSRSAKKQQRSNFQMINDGRAVIFANTTDIWIRTGKPLRSGLSVG